MEPKPSIVHNCSPPPGDELVKLGLRTDDLWVCPVCGDRWQLMRSVQPGGLVPMSLQKPEWLRLNDPQYETEHAPYYDPPDDSKVKPHDPGNPSPNE